ncbi:oncoprotein-induced transcript 3 protein-like [Hypanus sabinus]|uniref:oncoprotein-induced transcript 3 protein-like n=1 Tax=Hypanus sabinus TaxID=79690 RepID=UPI0028C38392|nr:oncoprotein-induced transcript 3 protein-like [Hypanus sabinus]
METRLRMSPAELRVVLLILGFLVTDSKLGDPCVTHSVLDQPWRSTNCSNTECTGGQWMSDGNLTVGWYRFNSSGGWKIPETVVPQGRCSGETPGWLNGSHPNVGEREVTRTVCFTWDNNTCYQSRGINVKNCSGYFVYWLWPTSWSNYAVYCTEPLSDSTRERQGPVTGEPGPGLITSPAGSVSSGTDSQSDTTPESSGSETSELSLDLTTSPAGSVSSGTDSQSDTTPESSGSETSELSLDLTTSPAGSASSGTDSQSDTTPESSGSETSELSLDLTTSPAGSLSSGTDARTIYSTAGGVGAGLVILIVVLWTTAVCRFVTRGRECPMPSSFGSNDEKLPLFPSFLSTTVL